MSNNINIAPGSYLNIQDWMLELDITTTELIIYAVIHSFSQDGSSTFKGSQSYLAKWAKCSRQQVNVLIKNLRDKKLIVVKDSYGINRKFCEYYTVRSRNIFQTMAESKKKQKKLLKNESNVSENLTDMCQESRQYVSENLTGMCRETRQNNKAYINLKKAAAENEAAEAVNTKIKELLGEETHFGEKFLCDLESFIKSRVGEEKTGEYLEYVYETVKAKNPKSMRALFRTLAVEEDVIKDFLERPKDSAPKPVKKKVCPVCKNEINAIYYCCPHCDFSFDKADDETYVNESKKVYEMDEQTRLQYNKEIDEAYGEIHFLDFRNEKVVKEREARILSVKQKFGVI